MIKFGTDGWRAIIGKDFTFSNLRKVAFAHSQVLLKEGKKRVIIGYDNRFMSEHFALEVFKVMKTLGLDAHLTNKPCTTPMVSFAVKYMGFDNGVMITASHNPPEYNGYKIKDSFGGSATSDFISRVESELSNASEIQPKDFEPEPINVWGEYVRVVKSKINFELLSQSELLAIHDAMYGSSAGLFSTVLSGTKIQVIPLRSFRDPLFGNHAPEPIEKHLRILSEKVRALNAQVGIANDGDGDRLSLIDENGNFVNSQLVYVLILYYLIKVKGLKDGAVVKTVSTTALVDRICKEENITLYEVPVGFKNVNDVVLREKVLFGGEESGGYGIIDFLPERDGLFSGISILELISYAQEPLSKIIENIYKLYGKVFYKRQDLKVSEPKKELLKSLRENPPEEIGGIKTLNVRTDDGLKLSFEDGSWLLMRASGTEPLIRLYSEAPSPERAESLINWAFESFST
ncbi:MAG: phosphoglucomutase/phosphomannomutase family protein [Aquificaceae bacterium]|nr:phosphoglucomutase/phosphomannomutase family protein [Aquificaceae bacterium]MDW8236921.1 phosphoglucomutase/phosphomannomutase family protein [Aquificaceae bacterium]